MKRDQKKASAFRNTDGIIEPLDNSEKSPENIEVIPPWVSEGREVYRRGLILALDLVIDEFRVHASFLHLSLQFDP